MEKILWILIENFSYSTRTSIGRMFFEYEYNYVTNPPSLKKEYFGFTLQDTARPGNVKVYGETCLPGGLICDISLIDHPHYGKTIVFHTEPDKRTIKFGKLTWTDCYAHGGNSIVDTLGCVLVAKNLIDKDHIQDSLKDELRIFIEQKIKEGYIIKARFINLDQINDSLISINLKKSIMTNQFWKGLVMALIGVVVAGFSTAPVNWSVIIVTLIGTLLVYLGTNTLKVLRPVSLPTTITFRDVVHALLILIGNGILDSIALIVIGTEISWLIMGKIVCSIALTYLTATFFGGPYSTKKVDWSYQARLEYKNKIV
jgi:hypothetical protein